ncbi:hypothetical protein GA0061078_1098 [Bifidobacterium bohemicum]|uniref:Uncharacterized protein n=1 Tax=Bifidobacterium bohemicum DSM 22767 TaxID=1437606 RepID=A0A086ZGK7_9BIFI|nr:hypothetical protein BBOH_0929 [Bifidobacterium bohemicum DSM 22767]SCB99383.1 hypothetical protein GA0061078_1098 [Bifidobacterium bohemicum]
MLLPDGRYLVPSAVAIDLVTSSYRCCDTTDRPKTTITKQDNRYD